METNELIGQKYRVLRQLARGVYEAERADTGERVLLKQLAISEIGSWKELELFRREAAVLSKLNHPGIPRYVDQLEIDTPKGHELYLAQALIPSPSLEQRIQDGWRPTEPEAREIARQLLEVLIYIHAFHPPIVHRDIKPANVLWGDDRRVALVDFGSVLTRTLAAQAGGSTVAGTFGYMAPEQMRGRPDARSDLYSLGMMLLTMLSGSAPEELPTKRLRIDVGSVLPGLTRATSSFIARLIEPVPEDRFSSAREALGALARESPLASDKRPVPKLPIAIALGVMVVAGLVGWSVALRQRSTEHVAVEVQASTPADNKSEVVREAIAEVRLLLGALHVNEESYHAERDIYLSAEPVGPGGANKEVWSDEPCDPSCNYNHPQTCHRFSCMSFQAGHRVYYRYACNATTPSGAFSANYTCAAIADLDGDGKSKMWVFGSANNHAEKGRIVAPIPEIGDKGHCKVGETFAGEIVDCNPGVY